MKNITTAARGPIVLPNLAIIDPLAAQMGPHAAVVLSCRIGAVMGPRAAVVHYLEVYKRVIFL
jgi:hypothetical protein